MKKFTTLESRISRLERLMTIRRRKVNEDLKRLPDGSIANRVSDVLSSFTGTMNPRTAVAILNRKGILLSAVNRNYPTPEDVANAIIECWDDEFGYGNSAAKFFIGNYGDAVHCALDLMPISGGRITLKFDWD